MLTYNVSTLILHNVQEKPGYIYYNNLVAILFNATETKEQSFCKTLFNRVGNSTRYIYTCVYTYLFYVQ